MALAIKKMKNFKVTLVCCLLLFSAVSLAQEETESDVEEVEVQVQDEEEPQPQPDVPVEEPSEPAPVDPVDTGEFSAFFLHFT